MKNFGPLDGAYYIVLATLLLFMGAGNYGTNHYNFDFMLMLLVMLAAIDFGRAKIDPVLYYLGKRSKGLQPKKISFFKCTSYTLALCWIVAAWVLHY